MRPIHAGHGDLNDGEAGDKGHERNEAERSVGVLAQAFPVKVFRCDGLLEEDGLGKNEDGSGHGDWVTREEDDRGGGDVCPDIAAEYEDAYLGEDTGFSKKPCHDVRSLG